MPTTSHTQSKPTRRPLRPVGARPCGARRGVAPPDARCRGLRLALRDFDAGDRGARPGLRRRGRGLRARSSPRRAMAGLSPAQGRCGSADCRADLAALRRRVLPRDASAGSAERGAACGVGDRAGAGSALGPAFRYRARPGELAVPAAQLLPRALRRPGELETDRVARAPRRVRRADRRSRRGAAGRARGSLTPGCGAPLQRLLWRVLRGRWADLRSLARRPRQPSGAPTVPARAAATACPRCRCPRGRLAGRWATGFIEARSPTSETRLPRRCSPSTRPLSM